MEVVRQKDVDCIDFGVGDHLSPIGADARFTEWLRELPGRLFV
jgi:hypothetical protein